MFRAGSGNPPGKNFTPFGNEFPEHIGVFIVNFQLLRTKTAHFFLEKNLALSAGFVVYVAAVYLGVYTPVLPGRAFITISFIRHTLLLKAAESPPFNRPTVLVDT
jgi:hypothetical protein